MIRSKFILSAAALALAAQAQSALASVTYICPELHGSELKVRVDSGCMSTSIKYQGNDLALKVDQKTATINVTGDMEFGGGGMIVTADCMGARSITLTAQDIDVRKYSVFYNGEPIGDANFIEDLQPKQCLSATNRHRVQSKYEQISRAQFKEWNENPMAGWQNWRGGSIFELLSPVLNSHPESMEGKGEAWIKVRKVQWRREFPSHKPVGQSDPFYAVSINHDGYLDDSVSGARFIAEVRMDEDGQWKLSGFWSQQMCARGQNAGQWTKGTCP